MGKAICAALVGAALLTAPVRAACWDAEEVRAAEVRDLQSMLMVTALRCRAAGAAIMEDYNGFVVANRGAIARVNARLRGHFTRTGGEAIGQRGYDGFTTALANSYGGGRGAPLDCASADAVMRHGADLAGSIEGLLALAHETGLEPTLPEGACGGVPVTVARIEPSTADDRIAYTEQADGARQEQLASFQPRTWRPVARPRPANGASTAGDGGAYLEPVDDAMSLLPAGGPDEPRP